MNVIVPLSEVPPDLLEFFEPVDAGAPPDVLVWKNEPSHLNHYAAYGTFIPDFAIRASTSQAGVCPTCGAAWARVMERESMVIRRSDWGEKAGNRTAASGTMVQAPSSRTLTWRPTCSCVINGPPTPATVLDIFAGSGTTLLVADRLGRHGIGIDLSGEYTAMAHRRLVEDAPLFADVTLADVTTVAQSAQDAEAAG